MDLKNRISENLKFLREKISDAERQSGRPSGCVKLQAVSKFHPLDAVLAAVNSGQFLFGENRVQEAVQKFEKLVQSEKKVELHIIGSLQRNKAKNAIAIASCIESVDRIELLEEIEKQCSKIEKKIDVFFEVHTGEESKSGFRTIDELEKALLYCAQGKAPHVCPKGFMTMAPFTKDEGLIRRSFCDLRNTAEKMQIHYPDFPLKELSMGMSNDFQIAIEEGSTLVRLGTAIFGEREYQAK
ncbi:YggS family pyridoxal phosphate-dependent enzyme [Treponema parvum]|uniref:Pyridoxal phosphate homeostasis protein n=2 Tax=Treponema parvum TaxID=138851 RepID=A0A975F1U9_9SPIR|nr:YggS family pyridoxal phosphate-dependent enzyme [Treponema parvum]